jgi:hypothetical protein
MRRDLEDDDDVVADGESVRVPLYLCDDATQRAIATDGLRLHDGMGRPAGYKSGYVFSGNIEHSQRDAYDAAAVRDARREARAARRVWIEDMTTAYRRTPHTDNGEPDAAEALLRRHLRSTEPDEDAAARAEKIRERTRAQYLDQLANAWRTNPQTNPRRADEVERQRRQWTAER